MPSSCVSRSPADSTEQEWGRFSIRIKNGPTSCPPRPAAQTRREALGALAIVHRGAAVDRLNRQPTKGDHARTRFLPRHHRQP
ncbi:protein of unknown function [Micropruina glycogenica]|uniref:Uncharacterized protein n=1 Tax=Micropruina glycogenica TaxID=75385 RepID=A0A2N9JCN7_9ACTN|nr:protein of unknown function [Micropruina glycogenica]